MHLSCIRRSSISCKMTRFDDSSVAHLSRISFLQNDEIRRFICCAFVANQFQAKWRESRIHLSRICREAVSCNMTRFDDSSVAHLSRIAFLQHDEIRRFSCRASVANQFLRKQRDSTIHLSRICPESVSSKMTRFVDSSVAHLSRISSLEHDEIRRFICRASVANHFLRK